MGTWSGHKAKFVRRFANLKEVRDNAVQSYCEAVRNGDFPDANSESYSMDGEEWVRFLQSEGMSEWKTKLERLEAESLEASHRSSA